MKTEQEIRERITSILQAHKLSEDSEHDWNLEERAIVELRWVLGE